MREITSISAIGSCRIGTPFKSASTFHPVMNNTTRVYGYTHTSAEALQQIKFLHEDFTPPPEVLPLLMPSTDYEALQTSIHPPSDMYFIELSSAKALRIFGVEVQLNYVSRHFADFFADTARTRAFWHLSSESSGAERQVFLAEQHAFHALSHADQDLLANLTLQLATPETLACDIAEIQERTPRCVFVTHCNANGKNGQPLPSRANFIDMAESVCMAQNANLFNPTASMQAFGQNAALSDPDTSLSHYSTEFGEFMFAGLFDRFIAPQHSGKIPASEALSSAINLFANRKSIKSISPLLGSVTLITGSLGAGGAERQLARLATEMKSRDAVSGVVEVIVSNLSPEHNRDFFLPALEKAGVPVSVISALPAQLNTTSLPIPLQDLLRHLPPQTQEALHRLTPHFQMHRPEVAYIWQDGAVLSTALAALVAEVPRIVISLRGMPPSLRPEMMKDEYFDMYRALSNIPGVIFSANTYASADAYASWLSMPAGSIEVVHNAAAPMPENGNANDIQKWEDFCLTTPDADFTYGAVFRFDQNKRPLLWLEFAAAALSAHPASRFVLVGDGAEMLAAQTYAREMGLFDRCLFVGKSRNVGFWLSNMDTLGLTSRLEGLPNVLIEAQLAGLPVISTPAGGASETFIHGKTGYLLDSSQSPSITQFLEYYLTLATAPERRKSMGKAAQIFARDSFDIDKILPKAIALLSGSTTLTPQIKHVAHA